MEMTKSGSQPSAKGPADWFTGVVRIDSPFHGKAVGWMEHVTDEQYGR